MRNIILIPIAAIIVVAAASFIILSNTNILPGNTNIPPSNGNIPPSNGDTPPSNTNPPQPPEACTTGLYDSFDSPALDESKWNDTTDWAGQPDEHLVNAEEKKFRIAQYTKRDAANHLAMKRNLYDETIEYDFYYISASGNHLHNLGVAPYDSDPWHPYGYEFIGYWNAPGNISSQTGKYHIIVDFDSAQEEMHVSVKKPDGTYFSYTDSLNETSPPYHLLMQSATGKDGLMHFEYKNFTISNC